MISFCSVIDVKWIDCLGPLRGTGLKQKCIGRIFSLCAVLTFPTFPCQVVLIHGL